MSKQRNHNPTSRAVSKIPSKPHYAPKSLPLAAHQKMQPVIMNPEIYEEAHHKEEVVVVRSEENRQMPPRLCLSDPMRTFR